MKKYLSLIFVAVLCVVMAVASSAADVYLTDGGTGNGTEANPFGTMDEAINAIAEEGGTVHIIDTYTCPDQYVEPAHAGDIVITGGKYIFTNGSYNRWYLSGEGSTTFENIVFEYGAGNTSLFIAQFNELIFGEGVTLPATVIRTDAEGKEVEKTCSCYVIGGYQYNKTVEGFDGEFKNIDEMVAGCGLPTDKDSKITAKSGRFHLIAGFCRGAATTSLHFSGKSYINISGDAVVTSAVYGGSVNGHSSFGGSEINISGGEIPSLNTTAHANDVGPAIGDVTVNISGGNVGTISMDDVLGKTVVNYTGGIVTSGVSSMDKTLVAPEAPAETGEEVEEIVKHPAIYLVEAIDGSTKLIASGDAKAADLLIKAFDEFEGEVFKPELPDLSTLPVVTTAATTAVADGSAGGFNPIIIAVIAAVVVVLAVVVIVVVKKKKQ